MSEPGFRTQTRRRRLCAGYSSSFARALFVPISLVIVGQVFAQPTPLTEAAAIRATLARPSLHQAEAARVAIAESGVTQAGVLPNPVVTLEQERIGIAGGDLTERSARIQQTLDLSGRRALARDAAGRRVDATRLDAQDRRLGLVAEARRAFAESLHWYRIEGAIVRWQQRIEGAAGIAARLVKAGEVSGYDRRRIEREAQTARARLSTARAEAIRSRELLAALIGRASSDIDELAGEQLPAPGVESLESALARTNARPDLAGLAAQVDAYEREREAAERGWVPDVTLGVGQKRVSEPGRSGSGLIIGVSMSIPLFDRGQATQQRSGAQAQALRAERVMALARVEAEVRAAWRQSTELREAGEAFRRESLTGSRDLSRIAEAAYRGGETNLLELLDAYRAELDAESTELDLALRARLARIELDRLSGVSFDE